MANNQLPGAILRRLSRVRAIESQLVDRLDQLGTAGAIDPEEHEVLRDAVVARRSGAVAGSGLRGRRDRRRRPCRPGGMPFAIGAIAALTAASGLIVLVRMRETRPG
jgi:hypothetical protein